MTEPTASIVIACHTEDRLSSLQRAIVSAQKQTPPPAQVIVAVDNNDRLCALLGEMSGVEIVHHRGDPGASGARNAGAAHAQSTLLVFLDDDTEARAGWLRELLRPFEDPSVLGTGGMTKPAWQCSRPHWFPDEFGWVVGASHAGLPTAPARVRNVWSENMAVRREAFELVGGFRSGFGKVGVRSRPEDTDLCIRIGAGTPEGHWVYVPAAVVDHEVPAARATFSFFLRRCYAEGAGKMELSAHLGADQDLEDERSFLLRTLPRAIVRDLRGGEFARALAIVAGTAAAAVGAAVSVVRAALLKSRGGASRSVGAPIDTPAPS
ncbi:MAG TPA: glycosyltransferase family 2 protein [Solirubrobacteraceae bacterium]|nr:glycosyltransferase family 2 protein [Solirubrobacteraceae bacterium]